MAVSNPPFFVQIIFSNKHGGVGGYSFKGIISINEL